MSNELVNQKEGKTMTNRPGRPRKPKSAQQEMRMIAVPMSLYEEILSLADNLEPVLGFRPTRSQTLKYVISEYKKNAGAKS
jgi:hypothetical protein